MAVVLPLEYPIHIFVGEGAAVRWAIEKFRNYLRGAEFMVLSNCSVLKKSFESEAIVPHMVHKASRIFALPIRDMALASKDDVVLRYSVTIQQSHIIAEVQLC